MRLFVVFLATLGLCQGRPQLHSDTPRETFLRSVEPYIVGGTNAAPGEFPWQLLVERNSNGWSRSCEASLLSSRGGLLPAHCVDGASVSTIRIVAGLWDRSDTSGTQTVYIASYTMHEMYGIGPAFANDIALLNFATDVIFGFNIQPALLPVDNSNTYAGTTCVITGWGRTDSTQQPNILQKGSIPVITTTQCNDALTGVGIGVTDSNICVHDPMGIVGACNGDSGSPLNCPDGGTRVVGIAIWNNCIPSYPSVYIRIGYYLGWIAANTP